MPAGAAAWDGRNHLLVVCVSLISVNGGFVVKSKNLRGQYVVTEACLVILLVPELMIYDPEL